MPLSATILSLINSSGHAPRVPWCIVGSSPLTSPGIFHICYLHFTSRRFLTASSRKFRVFESYLRKKYFISQYKYARTIRELYGETRVRYISALPTSRSISHSFYNTIIDFFGKTWTNKMPVVVKITRRDISKVYSVVCAPQSRIKQSYKTMLFAIARNVNTIMETNYGRSFIKCTYTRRKYTSPEHATNTQTERQAIQRDALCSLLRENSTNMYIYATYVCRILHVRLILPFPGAHLHFA